MVVVVLGKERKRVRRKKKRKGKKEKKLCKKRSNLVILDTLMANLTANMMEGYFSTIRLTSGLQCNTLKNTGLQ